MPPEVIIRISQWKNVAMGCLGSVMFAAMLVAILDRYSHARPFAFGLGEVFTFTVLLGGGYIGFRRAADRRAQVIIFKGGVSLQVPRVVYIPWDKITSCRSVGNKHIVLYLTEDMLSNAGRPNWLQRSFIQYNKNVSGAYSATIFTTGLELSHGQIAKFVEDWIAFTARHRRQD